MGEKVKKCSAGDHPDLSKVKYRYGMKAKIPLDNK
jgi:hypothetical protein